MLGGVGHGAQSSSYLAPFFPVGLSPESSYPALSSILLSSFQEAVNGSESQKEQERR